VSAPVNTQPLATMPDRARRAIRGVLTDIDDTLTTDGKLTADAYAALERLRAARVPPAAERRRQRIHDQRDDEHGSELQGEMQDRSRQRGAGTEPDVPIRHRRDTDQPGTHARRDGTHRGQRCDVAQINAGPRSCFGSDQRPLPPWREQDSPHARDEAGERRPWGFGRSRSRLLVRAIVRGGRRNVGSGCAFRRDGRLRSFVQVSCRHSAMCSGSGAGRH